MEKLDTLTDNEWNEFHLLLPHYLKIIQKETSCEKEYMACFSEVLTHVHIHIMPKTPSLQDHFKGPDTFVYLNCTEDKSLPKENLSFF